MIWRLLHRQHLPTRPQTLAGTTVVEADELSVGYADHVVSVGFSMRADPGSIVALTGPNGCGKSTLLRTLAGLLPPVRGSVRFAGRTVDEREVAFRRAAAAVFDDDAFFASLTVVEHLRMVAAAHACAGPANAAEHELEFFGLGTVARSVPDRLSSGQQRRLLLAALIRPSTLLLLDEPEQRLDAGMRDRLIQRLRAAKEAGAVVVLATHSAQFVSALADVAYEVGGEPRQVSPAEAADRMNRS